MSEAAISSMVDAETAAWNARDADALVSLFHPDAVWPWPPSADAHDPMTWVMPFGRYNRQRWKRSWQALFDTYEYVLTRGDQPLEWANRHRLKSIDDVAALKHLSVDAGRGQATVRRRHSNHDAMENAPPRLDEQALQNMLPQNKCLAAVPKS